MTLTSLIYGVLLFFALKLIANFGAVYTLYKEAETNPEASTSLMLEMEAALLIIAIILSALSTGDSLVNRPFAVAGWGFLTMIGSYVLIFIMLIILRIFSLVFKKNEIHKENIDSIELDK